MTDQFTAHAHIRAGWSLAHARLISMNLVAHRTEEVLPCTFSRTVAGKRACLRGSSLHFGSLKSIANRKLGESRAKTATDLSTVYHDRKQPLLRAFGGASSCICSRRLFSPALRRPNSGNPG